MWLTLLIAHAVAALFLLGAATHQLAAIVWPTKSNANFVKAFASVRSSAYTNGVIVLFLIAFIFGSFVYANYRVNVRPLLEDTLRRDLVGWFELKEHFLAIALMLLPAYWYLWRRVPFDKHKVSRFLVTAFVTLNVWFGFIIGHVVNNARGIS